MVSDLATAEFLFPRLKSKMKGENISKVAAIE
jgi:hypothetical protein